MKRIIASIGVFLSMGVSVAWAQIVSEKVSFPGAHGEGFAYIEQVSATFQKPEGSTDKLPAVVILHGSGGIDGRGASYAAELNKHGFATLEVFMFVGNGRPNGGPTMTLTHAYGALKYLGGRQDINPQAIGVMGFSWGGVMSLRMASRRVYTAFSSDVGALNFTAHVPLYPVCWTHHKLATDPGARGYGTYSEFTGAPVLIFAGGQDDYDAPDDCKKFIEAVDKNAQAIVQLQFYPEATHGWDSPSSSSRTIYDPTARQGKGGWVLLRPDVQIANDSRKRTVEFFTQHLKTQVR
jgi:uncharacterized protein